MKDTFTTKQILDTVPQPWMSLRKRIIKEDGTVYEYQIWRGGTNMVWVWACENYIKLSSKAFAVWNGKEWKKKRNKFIEIEYTRI